MRDTLPLSPTHAALAEGDPRPALKRIAEAGFRFVQLSAALPTMRPRELDRSARRDLLARLRRLELTLSGLDLWIPEEHFGDPAHGDRAMNATLEAIELAADLDRVPLSMTLPRGMDAGLRSTLADRADMCGVEIADFNRSVAGPDAGDTDDGDEEETPSSAPRVPAIGTGVDPATVLLGGGDPAKEVSRAAQLVSARFSDAARDGRRRPGAGRLDLTKYQVALLTRGDYDRPVVLDMRHIAEPWAQLDEAARAWWATGLLQPRGL
ncbi:MAG: hypothetical protein ACF8PN_09705 [Phycisphaerales bacterium]